jgi:putative transposase
LERIAMMLVVVSSAMKSRAALQLENIALRHQIGVLQRSAKKRLSFSDADRLFWIGLSRVWAEWRSALKIVRPDTVIAWHRNEFRKFWTWKVRPGRPAVSADIRALIRRMSGENPGWGVRDGYEGSMSLEFECKAPGLSHQETTSVHCKGS